ncbi:MAG: helix-turn-helix transcriptional regulator [Candidatus Thorarchaeota archaeon]
MRTPDIKRIILSVFRENEFYGYKAHQKLKSMGNEIDITRFYRVLIEMQKEDLLNSRWEKGVKGPRRRVYRLGKEGRKELDRILIQSIKTVHGFYMDYLRKTSPEVLKMPFQLMTRGLRKDGKIVYVTSEDSGINEQAIRFFHSKIPDGTIFFVKPAELALSFDYEHMTVLNGTLQDIPLKDNYIDLLVAPNLSKIKTLEGTLKEWHRLLCPDGRLAIILPTALLDPNPDPLLIGQFIEKFEHRIHDKRISVKRETLQPLLEQFFNKIEEKKIVHMTYFLAMDPRT